MTQKTLVLLIALEQEISPKLVPPDVYLKYSGVGKINAAIAAAEIHMELGPKIEIVNIGTCGSAKHAPGTILHCNQFIQMDMDATPAGLAMGETPFSDLPSVLKFGDEHTSVVICGSADRFQTDIPMSVDCVEMEAFAIATVCAKYQIPFRAIKVVSDQGGESGHNVWVEFLENKMSGIFEEIRAAL